MNLEELFDKYLHGDLPTHEVGKLKNLLLKDPQVGEQLVEYVSETALLVRVGTQLQGARAEAHAVGLKRFIKYRQESRLTPFAAIMKYGLLPLSAAALLLFMVRLHNFHVIEAATEQLVCRVMTIDGVVECTYESRRGPLKQYDTINLGDTIRTAKGSHIHLQYLDGSRVELQGDSTLTLAKPGNVRTASKHVQFDTGVLLSRTSRQPTGKPFVVTTPSARITVLGTVFMLKADSASTHLDMIDGRARMERLSDEESVEVSAGQYAVAARGVELIAREKQTASKQAIRVPRITRGLQVLYDFGEGKGDIIHDVSGSEKPLELHIGNLQAVEWIEGGLRIRSPTIIRSADNARQLIKACGKQNEITIEAWVRPDVAHHPQEGKAACIINLGSLFALQQGLDSGPSGLFNIRLRTSINETGSAPSVCTREGLVSTALTHIVYTRSMSGSVKIFVNGIEESLFYASYDFQGSLLRRVVANYIEGVLDNWSSRFPLVLANEMAAEDRPWLGDIYLVAIYSHALTQSEVVQNYRSFSR